MSNLSAENLTTIARLSPDPAVTAYLNSPAGGYMDRLMTAARGEGQASSRESMGSRTAFVAVCVAGIAVQMIFNPIMAWFRFPTLRISVAELMILAGPLITYTFAKTLEKHIAAKAERAR